MSTELTRRMLLVGGLAAAAGGGYWWSRERRRARLKTALTGLAEELGLGPEAHDLGSAYLALHPEEADADRLALLLVAQGGGERDEIAVRLAERIGRDWIELDTVQLDGWILARSEGRLLALASLLATEVSNGRG